MRMYLRRNMSLAYTQPCICVALHMRSLYMHSPAYVQHAYAQSCICAVLHMRSLHMRNLHMLSLAYAQPVAYVQHVAYA